MSYDLMVFNPDKAPRTEPEFLEWYNQQTEWEENHTYDDPKVTSPELSNWFIDMITEFPALNGPHAPADIDNDNDDDDDDDKITDYSIGKNIIYAAFRWSVAEIAYPKMLALAKKHKVGFYDLSGEEIIMFPNEIGTLESINKPTKLKPWWKFW